MAEDSKSSSIDPEVLQSGKVYNDENKFPVDADPRLLGKEGNKQEEEIALDADFIMLEKELVDVRESQHVASPENSISGKIRSANPVSKRNLLLEEKFELLELRLKILVGELKRSDSEKALPGSDCEIANDKLEKLYRKCEVLELELELERHKHNLHLEMLEEALTASDMKHEDLLSTAEASAVLSAELDMSREKMKDYEAQLLSSAAKIQSLEDLKSFLAELGSKLVSDLREVFERLELNTKELEDRLGKFQIELMEACGMIGKNTNVEEALRTTSSELSTVQEVFEISKTQAEELGQNIFSEDSVIREPTGELNLHKLFHEKMKIDISTLENLLSASDEDPQEKLTYLEEVQHKLELQVRKRDIVEACLRNKEIQTTNLEKELSKLIAEKKALQNMSRQFSGNISELSKELEARQAQIASLNALLLAGN